jgi:hypothetical protein
LRACRASYQISVGPSRISADHNPASVYGFEMTFW